MSLFKSYKLFLKKSDKVINVSKARNVLDVLLEEGVVIDYACQNVFCGRCKVKVLEGMENIETEGALERGVKAKCGYGPEDRITCKLRIKGDVVIDL
jgi:ferredoxin